MSRHTKKGERQTPATKGATGPERLNQPEMLSGEGLLESDVAARAYELWMGRGMPAGTDRDDWFEAENQLRSELGGRPTPTPAGTAEQAREASESRHAREAGPSNRDRMVAIGRGNQQAGRGGRPQS